MAGAQTAPGSQRCRDLVGAVLGTVRACRERPSCLPHTITRGHEQGSVVKPLPPAWPPRPPGAQRNHKDLSHLSVVSPRAGGGGRALRDPVALMRQQLPACSSHPASAALSASSRETEGWRCFWKVCVGGRRWRGAGRVGAGAEQPALAGRRSNGRRWALAPGKLSATAAPRVGGSSSAGFQTITVNICKQIKK